MNTTEYYDLEEFKDANNVFEDFLSQCIFIKAERGTPTDFKVSTITYNTKILNDDGIINTKILYERIKIDNDVVYIEVNKNITKGFTKKKKNKVNNKAKDKRKLGKGKPFSNQVSFGVSGDLFEIEHKNPICFKLFSNGTIAVTGCKSEEEMKIAYGIMSRKINNLNTTYTIGDKTISICPIRNMKKYEELDIRVEMINGTFRINYRIDLDKFYQKMTKKYTSDEVFIDYNKKSPVIVYYKTLKKIDKKGKAKYPSIFVYNSGAVIIISTSHEDLMKTYDFISEFLISEYDTICETKLCFNEEYFETEDVTEEI